MTTRYTLAVDDGNRAYNAEFSSPHDAKEAFDLAVEKSPFSAAVYVHKRGKTVLLWQHGDVEA